MPNLHGISQRSFDLIVMEEVSSRARYEQEYRRPIKPGGASGVTVGIGYDCGYSTADQIRRDWAGQIPQEMVNALASVAGIKGDAALAACRRIRNTVSIPWDAAVDVFSNVSLPKYLRATRNALPNFDELPPDCKGVLGSLTYNRGASYTISEAKDPSGRYREMRGIRSAMVAEKYEAIPDLIRSMRRLWTTKSVRGVALRRAREADMFEEGLAQMRQSVVSKPPPIQPTVVDDDVTAPYEGSGDDRGVTEPPPFLRPAATGGLNVQPVKAKYSVECRVAQEELDAMGYHEVGEIDGRWGGKTAAAIKAFYTDRGINGGTEAELGPRLNAEISRAKAEGFRRPIAPSRANATPVDLAPKNEAVKTSLWQQFWAKVGAGFAAIGLGGSTLSSWFDAVREKTYAFREFFYKVPPEVWFILIGVVAGVAWYASKKTATAVTKDYNSGRLN